MLMKVNLKGVKITWLGHATFKVETPAGKTVLIDPWVMNNPKCPDGHKRFEKIDVMLCTHGHGDHIGDAVELVKKHDPVAIGVYELCLWLQKKGAKQISPMNKGGSQKIGDIRVTMVSADHSCGIEDDGQIIYGGEACGYVIEFENGLKIYHAGDNNEAASERSTGGSGGDRTRPDAELEGLHGHYHQVADQADFFLHEGLRIFHARQQSIEARHCFDTLPYLLLLGKERAAGFLILILRAISEERLHSRFKLITDIDHE